MTIPTNGRDGAPIPSKPNNPPTSNSGVSGEPVGPYAPTRGTNGALLREWLAEQFGVLPTHIWTEDRVVKPLGARIDGLVDVVLKQEQRLNGQFEAIDKRHECIIEALPDVSLGGEPLVTKGFADAQYDRGVADGRASIGTLASGHAYQEGRKDAECNIDHEAEYDRGFRNGDAARAERGLQEFERGKAVGASEREAELLDQGWTPPGAVISWADNGTTQSTPTDADLWETALIIAGSQRNRRELEHSRVRADAVWFYQELKAGPDDAVDWLAVDKYTKPVLKNDDGTDTEDIQTEPRMGTGND